MTPDEAIEIVKAKANCRTRVVGAPNEHVDEVLVEEVERLRRLIVEHNANCIGSFGLSDCDIRRRGRQWLIDIEEPSP